MTLERFLRPGNTLKVTDPSLGVTKGVFRKALFWFIFRLISEIFQCIGQRRVRGHTAVWYARARHCRARVTAIDPTSSLGQLEPLPRAAADTLVSAELWCRPHLVSVSHM